MSELIKIGEFRYTKLNPIPIWSAGKGESIVRLSEIAEAGMSSDALDKFESAMSISTFPVFDGFQDCVFAMSFETWMKRNWLIESGELVRFFKTDIELMYPGFIDTPIQVWRSSGSMRFISIDDVRSAGLSDEYVHMFEVDRYGSTTPRAASPCYYDHDFDYFMKRLVKILGERNE